jgi:signal peptidase I
MFTPKWKKEAKLLYKGAQKFLNYKRDLLPPDRVSNIESRRADLLKAMKDGDREAAATAEKQLTAACEKALPTYRRPNWMEENLEVFFVAIVVALGIRAYYLQPFRIPTGSMQPTLNGITGQYEEKEDFPVFPVRWAETVLRGRSYAHTVLDRDRTFISDDINKAIVEMPRWNFFTFTYLRFTDGNLRIHAPRSVVLEEFGLEDKLETSLEQVGNTRRLYKAIGRMTLPKGTVIASGTVDSGDLVLVDKFSYHFRRPKRGEVWVFDTRGIEGIHRSSGPQGAGSHYIKRLAGLPGDEVRIEPPKLYINGKLPTEEKMLRHIMDQTGPFSNPADVMPRENVGYQVPDPRNSPIAPYITGSRQPRTLAADTKPGYREYFSLGDNTDNSLDSRYWGPVYEYNVVGPALFSLWPFTSGHWGFIK